MRKKITDFDIDLEEDIKEIKSMFIVNAVLIFTLYTIGFIALWFLLHILKAEIFITYVILFFCSIYTLTTLVFLRKTTLKTQLMQVKNNLKNLRNPDSNFQYLGVDSINLYIGDNLVKLIESDKPEQNEYNKFLPCITAKRTEICKRTGYIIPAIRITDKTDLEKNECEIAIRNNLKIKFKVYPKCIAIENYSGDEGIVFIKENYIIFEHPVAIIKKEDLPENYNDKTFSSIEIILKHIEYLSIKHADEVLTNNDLKKIINLIEDKNQKETIMSEADKGIIRNVYANLIKEDIALTDIIKFFDLYTEYKQDSNNAGYISERIRNNNTFRTQITNKYAINNKIKAYSVSKELERLILEAHSQDDEYKIINRLSQKININSSNLIVCSTAIRLKLFRLINEIFIRTHVISYSEIIKNVEFEIIDIL